MSEQNPYIVREEEGKAATIRDFVTGIPLKPEEILPDEHGIHPVSPLGFLNRDDGTALGVHDATTGSIMYDDGVTFEEASQLAYVVEGKYSVYTGDAIAFPVMYLERNSNNTFTVKVDGLVPTREMQKFYFRNATSDDYGPTGLVDDNYVVSASSFTDDGVDSTIVLPAGTASFAGIVGVGKLLLCVQPVQGTIGELKKYLLVQNGDSVEHTGIFKPGSGPGAPFLKMYDGDYGNPVASTGSFDMLIAYNTAAWNYIDVKLGNGTWYKLENETYDGQTVPPDHRPDNHIFYSSGGNTNCTVIHIDNAEFDNGFPIFRTWCWNSNQNYGPYQSTEEGVADTPAVYTAQTSVPSFVTIDCINDSIAASNLGGTVYYQRMNDAWSCAGKSSADPPDDFYFWIFNIKQVDKSCYEGNGYSDREVADWVRGKLDPVIGYGKHPMSDVGRLDGAGAFARWFVSSEDTEISGRLGSKQVFVPGFGLGLAGSYQQRKVSESLWQPVDDLVSGGWLTFGYGTKHDAYDTVSGNTALPMDWPFTADVQHEHADETIDNSITLSRDGIDVGGAVRGKLAQYDDCPTCGGTGMVGGNTCTDCCGTGYAHTGTVMNRIHVCLYNDFSPSDSAHGHTAGTTVLKKTFINLGTSLDTRDGDEYEITVSLPNVNLDDAFPAAAGNERYNQSGYYAFISQPRVYVVSGTWKFSDTRVSVVNPIQPQSTDSSITAGTITVSESFAGIADSTRIRVTVTDSGYPMEETTVTGIITGTTIVLDGCQTVTFRRGYKYTICGAAYVEDNNDTLPEGSTPIGLNAVRNYDGELGGDIVASGDGLQVYNKFYGVSDTDSNREQVIAQSDKRQVVATVYPTVTNTFSWELSGSKKLANLDRIMTMEAEDGAASILSRVAWMNRSILMGHPAFAQYAGDGRFGLGPYEYPIDISLLDNPADASSDSDYSYIAKVMQVAPMEPTEDGYLPEESNPVRQAIRAVRMLAADYRNSRVRTGSIDIDYANDVFLKEPTLVDDTWADTFAGDTYKFTEDPTDSCNSDAQSVRLRNLAPVVTQAASYDDHTPVSPLLDLTPYVWDDGTNREVSEYHTGNPYRYGEYGSTDAIQEVTCDFVNKLHGKNYIAENSILGAMLRKSPSWLDTADKWNDLMRAVEIAAIDLGDEVLSAYNTGDSPEWTGVFNPMANLVSPDNIPVPQDDISGISFDSSDEWSAWFGGDPHHVACVLHGYQYGTPVWTLVATTMDNTVDGLSELTAFLVNYVPSYGADLPVRNWDSFRVKVKQSGYASETDPVYLTRMKWYGTECSDEFRGNYAADAFIGSTEYSDVNLNRVNVAEIARNYSSTPYAMGGNFDPARDDTALPFTTDSDTEHVAYIRMFMKFTFSADAGRWYCTDYRQAPVSYLTPLYGSRALEEKIGENSIWVESCGKTGWREATRQLYSECRPMDINPVLTDEVMRLDSGSSRLMRPYLPVDEGGLGLGIPCDRDGERYNGNSAEHRANFWNVRWNIRPATGALPDTDIPSTEGASGGIMSDAVLWGQYDYPAKGEPVYSLPGTNPAESQ